MSPQHVHGVDCRIDRGPTHHSARCFMPLHHLVSPKRVALGLVLGAGTVSDTESYKVMRSCTEQCRAM